MMATTPPEGTAHRGGGLPYRFLHPIIWCWVRVFYRYRVRGVRHVPVEGGALIASNHASYFDPIWIGAGVVHRAVAFMSTTSVGRVPVLGWLIRGFNGLTILRRTGFNKDAMVEFIRVLHEDGRLLLVFPEGTRTEDGTLGSAHRGISLLAREAGVPVVPAFIAGARASWPKGRLWPSPWGRIEVAFGPPIRFADAIPGPGEASDDAFARVLMERIAILEQVVEEPLSFREGLRRILGLKPADPDRMP